MAMKGKLAVTGVVAGLVLAGTAGGYSLGRHVPLYPGDTATFAPRGQQPGGWWCHYFGTKERGSGGRSHVSCAVGDQTPNVSMLFGRKLLTVEVVASAEHTRVSKVRKRVCAEPGRCFFQDTYTFAGGAGG